MFNWIFALINPLLHEKWRKMQFSDIARSFVRKPFRMGLSVTTFPMLKKLVFKINLVLDTPEGVKLSRLTENFRKF